MLVYDLAHPKCVKFVFVSILLASMAFITFGCNKDQEAETAAKEARKLSTTSLKVKGLEKQTFDLNEDGVPDQVRYIRPATEETAEELVYATYDINFDTINDLTEFYESGEHVKDEIDLDYDGITDVIVWYHEGHVAKKEFSYDFEGNRYGIQFFDENGNRTEIQHDIDGDGKVDKVEYFKPGESEPYQTTEMS